METSTDPRGAGRADAEGRGMAMSGPPRRTHIHAVHASSRHPWKERRNVALHTESSMNLCNPSTAPAHISRPLPASLSPGSAKPDSRGVLMCHEVVLLLKGQAHVGDKKLPLSGAACEPGALSWAPWGVAQGHCTPVTSGVPVYCF